MITPEQQEALKQRRDDALRDVRYGLGLLMREAEQGDVGRGRPAKKRRLFDTLDVLHDTRQEFEQLLRSGVSDRTDEFRQARLAIELRRDRKLAELFPQVKREDVVAVTGRLLEKYLSRLRAAGGDCQARYRRWAPIIANVVALIDGWLIARDADGSTKDSGDAAKRTRIRLIQVRLPGVRRRRTANDVSPEELLLMLFARVRPASDAEPK